MVGRFRFLYVRPIRDLILPPSRDPLGVFSCVNIRSVYLGYLLTEIAFRGAIPSCPDCHLPGCQTVSPVRHQIFSLVVTRSFSVVTGYSRLIFIPYILVDALGWVVSDVSLGIMGGFGSFNIRPPHPNDPVGIDLTPTLIPAANLRIHTRRKTKKKKNDHRKGSIYNFATANQS